MSDESTFSTYGSLPPLPLPDLEETCRRYLDSVAPLVDAEGYAEAEAAVSALLEAGGQGRRLDDKLRELAATEDNWLSRWWDNTAYLAFPEPILINSNFGISCDARTPSDDPATRAAEVSARALDFYVALVNETLPPEKVGKAQAPLDMSLFKRILGATRTPGLQSDEIVVHGPETARHIVVLRRNQVFTIPVLDDDGRAMSTMELARAFQHVLDTADAEVFEEEPVAVLTTERRPVWALERARLLSDPDNAATLEAIETAVFGVFFDEESYDTFNATARGALMGRPGNRWMDKVFNFVVDARGRVSQHGEHSPADGMQFVSIFDHACDKAQHGVFRNAPAETPLRDDRPTPKRHEWSLSPETLAAIDAALAHFEAKTDDIEIEVLHFDAFGKDLIKTFGSGPDPFVQMGYQLAFHRLHGRIAKTYESGQTRAFRLGRTETIRSASKDAAAFVAAMDNPAADVAARRAAALAAFATHARLGKEASQGQGCDRHLLGLALMARDLGEDAPALFGQEVWTRGWELSTAQLPMNALMVNGFGPVTHSGYGIGYVIQKDTITCHISTYRSHSETSSVRFARALSSAFEAMRGLFVEA